ncbi:MAG: alpha/beta fold hydrolase [Verrucomicrobia bacterium]|nr:alpha/beta fold hydrolase [Verrucomicrobiota bacterium]
MQLNYFTCGEGFPLIILHGLLGSSDNWQILSKRFAEHYQVFALDLRNHGASPHSDRFDYPSMADDLREFMDAQQIAEAIVLGHSMGGKTAMQFAADNPDRVRKLVVADIAPKAYPPHHTEILDALWTLDLPQFEDRTETDQALAADIPQAPLRSFLLKSVTRDETGEFTWKINLRTIREQYGNITVALDIRTPFVKPTLFIRGAKSDYILPGDEEAIRSSFPAAEFVVIEGAGHWLHAEKPQEFFSAVMEFLDSKR